MCGTPRQAKKGRLVAFPKEHKTNRGPVHAYLRASVTLAATTVPPSGQSQPFLLHWAPRFFLSRNPALTDFYIFVLAPATLPGDQLLVPIFFFWTDASLLHQQRSRPFLWVSTLEVKQSRYKNQTQPPKPAATRQNQSAKRLCVPRAQYSRSSQKSRCNRAEHAGGSQNARVCQIIKITIMKPLVQRRSARKAVNRRRTAELPTDTVRYQAHSSEKGRYKLANFPRGEARPARAPWWSASGDLLARTTDARPAQGTPWWSASGAAPSNSRHHLRFYY